MKLSFLTEKVLAEDPVVTSNKLNEINGLPGNVADKTKIDFGTVNDVIKQLTSNLLYIVVFLAAAFFLYGVFSYIISYGNESKSAKAKQLMTWAVIGIIVALLAQAIVIMVGQIFYSGKAPVS